MKPDEYIRLVRANTNYSAVRSHLPKRWRRS